MIEKYADDYSKDELLGVLKHISSDLYLYLQGYDYKHELLNDYFSDYKYQKVTNKITAEFRELVEKQAVDREYLRILPARSEKTEAIDMQNTAVYFVDAMGVEYMAYIMSLCREFNLMTYTTLCHCEVPSITSKNKDFVEVFENHGGVFIPDKNGIKTLDEMKHHGTDNFDFVNNHLPTYLYDELKVIRKVLEEVNSKLQKYDRVVLISDHGASRLSVISGQENKHEMSYRAIVDQIVEVSDGAYERHVEAVKKLTTAFLKLLFPHVKSVEDINRLQFKTYCLQPAVKMRKIVQLQLEELDPKEYKKEEKQMPTFSLRKDV